MLVLKRIRLGLLLEEAKLPDNQVHNAIWLLLALILVVLVTTARVRLPVAEVLISLGKD